MAKRRNKKQLNEMYFGPEQELAVVNYLNSDNEIDRNVIYNKFLREPLNKMTESIIRKYKLYRKGESFENLHADTLSFLMTKAHKFDNKLGKKAYSYYGTICKRYIISLLQKDEKTEKQLLPYDDYSKELEELEELSYVIDEEQIIEPENMIHDVIDGIKNELYHSNSKKKINENEIKIGEALIDILENWKLSLDNMEGSTKYNKNSVLETMRNYTNLSTKDIRVGMRRFKNLYNILKNSNI